MLPRVNALTRPAASARFRNAAALVFLAAGIAATALSARLETDNSIERWVAPDSPGIALYRSFRETFGADEFLLVAISGRPLFEQSALDAMLDAERRLLEIPHVARVSGIPTVYRELFGGEDREGLEQEFAATPFYDGLVISRDRRTGGLFLELDPPEDAPGRHALIEAVRAAVRPLRDYGFRVDVVGPPALNAALDYVSARETARMLPIALALSSIVLAVLLRSLRTTLAAFTCGWISVALPMGVLYVTGQSVSMVSTILPPLLWVMSLSHSVHVVSHFRRHGRDGETTGDAVARALSDTWLPCLLAAVTTAAGFLSLAFSPMPPIRLMGMLAAFGIIAALLVNFTVLPALICWMRARRGGAARGISKRSAPLISACERAVVRAPRIIMAVFAAVIAVGLLAVWRIRPEPNPIKFLPDSAPIAESYRFVFAHLSGAYTVEVVADCPEGWLEPKYWPVLDAFARTLEAREEVARALSPLDFLKKLHQWDNEMDPAAYRLPADRSEAEALLSELSEGGRVELARLVSPDGKRVRVSVVARAMEAERLDALIQHARSQLAGFPRDMNPQLTGIVWLLHNAQMDLVRTQIRSFAFAFLTVFGVIWIGLRSLKLTLISIPPNIAPIAAVFAAMPLLSLPLDAATVLVAGVALGIAVDNTVHLIAVYRGLAAAQDQRNATSHALRAVGPAILYTSVTSCIGFLALCASGFMPIRYFGILSTIAMLVALAADLMFTPALLSVVGRAQAGSESGVPARIP